MKNIIFACVGTDRSTGDALGPLVGSRLEALGFPVIGTLDKPLHAMNLKERIENEIPKDAYVIAVDACLGNVSSVGSIQHNEGPMKPGAGVDKDLPPIGDEHYVGIVNVGGFMEYFVLQNTRLSLVMKMADEIAEMIAIKFNKDVRQLRLAAAKENANG